jgi:hypothetical protein
VRLLARHSIQEAEKMTAQPIKSKAESDVPLGIQEELTPVGREFREKLRKDQQKQLETEEKSRPIILDHLNMMENPDIIGKPVIVEAVVSSTSVSYAVPAIIKATVKEKDQNPYITSSEFASNDPINLELVGIHVGLKNKRIERRFRPMTVLSFEEQKFRNVYLLRVRPPVFTLEKRGEKIVDEKGFEYKSFDIYIASDKSICFQPSSLIRLEGVPFPNPRTQKTTLLAYKVEFPEETQRFDAEKLMMLKLVFEGKTAKERFDWILSNFESYSQIIGRRNLATSGFLGFFSPEWVQLSGEKHPQRGWANIEIIGDTTTAKSETVRKLISLLKAGVLITAETASTVGLTGTATQIEKEGWFVDWGFLVLQDRRLLAIDGAHKLSQSNWAVLAEAERSGVIAIAKAAKNSAYARTRQIKIANAIDQDAGRYATKSISSFLYPIQSLTTILDKTSIARLDLAVFSNQYDVEPSEINKVRDGGSALELDFLSEVLRWVWSNTAKVVFTEEAFEYLLGQATELYNLFFSETIPLVTIDQKWKLARLSVAAAYLTLSTDDFQTVTVTKEHVEIIVEFLKAEYTNAGLNILAKETRFEKLDLQDVRLLLAEITAATRNTVDIEKVKEILRYIVLQGRFTKDDLKTQFSLSDNNELRPLLSALKNANLIKPGRGFYSEPKLIEAYKISKGFKL